jgi:hypothetical protein
MNQLHYVLIEHSPSVRLANIQKTVIKQLTCDLTLSKLLTCTAHGNNLFHWTLINLLSPSSINEKITYVLYIEGGKQHNQPDKPSAPPSQAHCQSFTYTVRLSLNTGPFCGPGTQKGSIFYILIPLMVLRNGTFEWHFVTQSRSVIWISNFVDRGLGEWEWLGPGSTKINKET